MIYYVCIIGDPQGHEFDVLRYANVNFLKNRLKY